MTPYSPQAVRDLKKQIAHAAITRTMRDRLWRGSAETGYSSDLVDGDYPPVNGPTGEIELRPLGVRGNVPATKVNPWEDLYKPWIDKIDEAFTYWDELVEPSGFDAKLDAARDAVYRLTLQSGSKDEGESKVGDTELSTSIAFVGKWIAPGTTGVDSATVRAFDDAYGAARMTDVINTQREPVIVLGLALAGEQKIWDKARADLMNVMDGAKASFEENPSGFDLEIFLALVDLVASFASGGLATGLGILSSAGGLVEKVLPKETGSKVGADLSGDRADDVFENMVKALGDIKTGIYEAERDLATMLSKATGEATDPKFRESYHINPAEGIAPGVADGKPINIQGDLDVYRQVGYEQMPQIAGELGRSGVSLTNARDLDMWHRPYVFGVGSDGCFQQWSDLYDVMNSVILSTAHEIVLAGQKLAVAAGYLEDADDATGKALKGVEAQVNGAAVGWDVDDSTPAVPPPRGPGGRPMPF